MNVSSSVEQGEHEHEHDNKHQGSLSKTQVLVTKQIKARKVENKVMDHHVEPMMMSSTSSFENFEHNSVIADEKNEGESINSYFELPISHVQIQW
ncbi:unnamed protein product [Lupinus luteus]|uniref:Uncharacterized protein n=1 Tax=Lupinus luteus TaxID=3873 RepID=A0AAV1VXG8_LUPLU